MPEKGPFSLSWPTFLGRVTSEIDVYKRQEPRPEKPATAKTLVPGDETDGWLIYRMNGGPLQVSVDGVYFRTLDPWNAVGLKVYGGQGGAVLVPTDKLGIVT